MNKEEAIRNFEKVRFLNEQIEIDKEINNCCFILSQDPVNMFQVNQEINLINEKYPENLILFNLIFPPKGNIVKLNAASSANLIEDLKWKLDFLRAEKIGKTFDEFCKAMKENKKIRMEKL